MFSAIKNNIAFFALIILVLILPWWAYRTWIFDLSLILFFTALFQKRVDLRELYREKILLLIIVFVFFTYASILWSPSSTLHTTDFSINFNRFKYYLFFILGIYFSSLSKRQVEIVFLFLSLAPLFIVYEYYALYFHWPAIDFQIIRGFFHSDLISNIYILFSATYFYIKLFTCAKNKHFKFLIIYFTLFFIISGSLFIFEPRNSRLISLTFFAVLTLVPFFYMKKLWSTFLFVILTICFYFYISQNEDIQKGVHDFKSGFMQEDYRGSFGARLGLLIVGYKIFSEHPIIGRGILDIRDTVINFHKEHPIYLQYTPERHFHNEHINLLVQVGIIGYSLFLVIIFLLFKMKIHNKEISVFKNTSIIIFLLLMIGEHYLSYKTTANIFIVLMTLFVFYRKIESIDPKINKESILAS